MDRADRILDLERSFLSDLLEMIEHRLSAMSQSVEPEFADAMGVNDAMEHICGVGVVAVQRYIASVANTHSLDKKAAIALGPRKCGLPIAAILNAAANYWKHAEDGEPHHKSTLEVLEKIGITEQDREYCVLNILDKCDCPCFLGVQEELLRWRHAVYLHHVNGP